MAEEPTTTTEDPGDAGQGSAAPVAGTYASLIRKNRLFLLAALWALFSFVFVVVRHTNGLLEINTYILIGVSFIAAGMALAAAVRSNDKGVLLYGALGLTVLAVGSSYFTIVDFVKDLPPWITVGTFSQVCCYLFFLSMLIELQANRSPAFERIAAAVNLIAVLIVIMCAWAVAANSFGVLRVSLIVLDGLCILGALTLLPEAAARHKNARFFAIMLIVISAIGIIYTTGFVTFGAYEAFVLAVLGVLYLLFTDSIIALRGIELAHR